MTTTRSRADGTLATGDTATCCAQRAGAGLVITDGIQPSAVGQGIADPDPVNRSATGAELAEPDLSLAYGGDAYGYTDHLILALPRVRS